MTQKQSQILSTALTLFHQNGFSRTGVDKIISTSQVAKMTFYKYFPSKTSLIEDCLKEESLLIQTDLTHRMNRVSGQAEKLKAFFQWHVEFSSSHHFNGCLFNKATFECDDEYGSIFKIIHRHKHWKLELVKNLLMELQVSDPATLAHLLVNMAEGMLVNARFKTMDYLNSWTVIENLMSSHRVGLSA